VPEIRLTGQKHIIQTVHVLSPVGRVHLVQDMLHGRRDVLPSALLEDIDEVAVEELPGRVVLRETGRVDVVGEIVEFGVVDAPYPAKVQVGLAIVKKDSKKALTC
jgi:hypothetical protein